MFRWTQKASVSAVDALEATLQRPHLKTMSVSGVKTTVSNDHLRRRCRRPEVTTVSSASPSLCYEIDWRSRIIAVRDSYVVLDKPAGTLVGGTTDNIEETCVNFVTRALKFTTPLMTTHQIDNCTEGCVVLARTKDYCSVFHKKIMVVYSFITAH
ncbi:hypothetical protein E3N88_07879 [Mikania micrantha]|uniref:Pseudouridine synthase RsuA/RluA-like domain-containing protein n=1 Tax=Mikania micrantha TaxID=192012 RepID=A0A5N6PES5_9ASTR|nr:hypothetical protein E3N88_07879 [Mikania micrantha]